jgi:hypothetical protein
VEKKSTSQGAISGIARLLVVEGLADVGVDRPVTELLRVAGVDR